MIKLITAEMVFRSYFACRKWSVPPAAKKKKKKWKQLPMCPAGVSSVNIHRVFVVEHIVPFRG